MQISAFSRIRVQSAFYHVLQYTAGFHSIPCVLCIEIVIAAIEPSSQRSKLNSHKHFVVYNYCL